MKRYPLAQPTFSNEEIEAGKAVLSSNMLTMGKEVDTFQNEFAKYVGSKYALMVNSGSSANLLMVDALLRRSKTQAPLKPGDEVIVPAMAWPTTVWPILQLGLVPVFVDIELKTLAIDLESVRSALTPRTKAIFLIHVLGQVVDMKPMIQFCKDHNLVLIEDVCESLGGFYDKKHAGNFGLMGSFSLYFSHHISTIEGGMIITSDKELYDDLISTRSHGWIRGRSDYQEWVDRFPQHDPRFMFVMSGYNVRPMEVQAGMGRIQLKKLDHMLDVRERLAIAVDGYAKTYAPWMRLVGSENLPRLEKGLPERRMTRRHSWMTLPFILSKDAPMSLKAVKEHFEKMGVETRSIIAGNLSRHPASQHYQIKQAKSLKNADLVLESGFMIGCHPVQLEGNLEILEPVFKALSRV